MSGAQKLQMETQVALIAGLLTLSGVVVTALASGFGAVLRRRWSRMDREQELLATERRELRALRREAYAELLSGCNRASNVLLSFASGVASGELARWSESATEAEQQRYLKKNAPYIEELDALSNSAAVVAGPEVARLIKRVELELIDVFADAASGVIREAVEYRRTRDELLGAMQAELSHIG